MKQFLIILCVAFTSSFFAQQIDYNTKKGYVATGYDVVSYFNKEVKKGNKKYIASYDGAKFKFSSEKNLNLFKEDASKYVPQYGGYCAYAVAEKKIKMYIDPEVYEIRDGKLYLFFDPWIGSKLKEWQDGDTKALQAKGDKNWEELKHK